MFCNLINIIIGDQPGGYGRNTSNYKDHPGNNKTNNFVQRGDKGIRSMPMKGLIYKFYFYLLIEIFFKY